MPRDFQRARVYCSEQHVRELGIHHKPIRGGLDGVREVVHGIMRSRWWKARCPDVTPDKVIIEAYGGVGDETVDPEDGTYLIRIGSCRHLLGDILHELAHVMNWENFPRDPGHGPHFCRYYIELVERMWPGVGRELEDRFREHDVVVAPRTACAP